MIFRKLLTAICLLASVVSYAQNVGINADNTTPDPSAMLDVKSTSKGMLIPRMSMSERDLIPSPQTGLMIYQNNNTPGYYYNSGTPGAPDWRTVGASASGSSPFIPRFTGASSLGNSNIIDSSVGLYYNKLPTAATNYIKIWLKMKPAPYSNYCLIEGSGGSGNTFLGLTDSTVSSKGILMGKNLSTNTDSVAMVNFSNYFNTLNLGKAYTPFPFFTINLTSGLMGYSSDPAEFFLHGARFTINAPNDTAGYFTSSSNNHLGNGILRAEYKGTNLNDHVAVYGKSVPYAASNYGIGVKGEGGWIGIEAKGANTGTGDSYGLSAGGYSNGTAFGVRGDAFSNGTPGGTKYGIFGSAFGGTTNWAGYFAGHTRVTGKFSVVTTNDTAGYFTSASSNFLSNGILRAEYKGTNLNDHIAVYGKSVPDPTGFYGIGVKGEGGFYGVEAKGVNTGNSSAYGVYASGLSNGDAVGVRGEALSNGIIGGNKYGVYGVAFGGAVNYAGYFYGDVTITGSISKGSGTFKIDHPQDPENKYLYHSFVESPDMMNIYNGNIVTDANGLATITMPGYFDALNKDFRYQLTVVDENQFAQARVSKKINGNSFTIMTDKPNVEVSWQVTGIRQDKFANAHRVVPEVDKAAEDKGKYIHPLEWNQPETKGIDYLNNHPELQKPKKETKWVPQPVPAEEPVPAKTQR